ncbi:MAG TPA: TIGR00159 family protein [Chloroflexi bacterium]|nr:TIGR00159 family protein [Chloroflexota bacterium]
MSTWVANLLFLLQRFTWASAIDVLLVTLVFFVMLRWLRTTQAMALVRGLVALIILVVLLTSVINLPAFSWLLRATLPALILAIPVIFAPEIRQALERLGQAEMWFPRDRAAATASVTPKVVEAVERLAKRHHGALIVFQRVTPLGEYESTGVLLDAYVSPELLLQIFYPNTPLHDGAVIIAGNRIRAAACVLPLSSSGILTHSPERQMGLRHRAALGIAEVSDAVVVVVSEETGKISLAHDGRILHSLSPQRLQRLLTEFFPEKAQSRTVWQTLWDFVRRLMASPPAEDDA